MLIDYVQTVDCLAGFSWLACGSVVSFLFLLLFNTFVRLFKRCFVRSLLCLIVFWFSTFLQFFRSITCSFFDAKP